MNEFELHRHLRRVRALPGTVARPVIPSVELPDADDRHVVAAAIHGGASLIVTFNLKDFPPDQLKRYNLAAQDG